MTPTTTPNDRNRIRLYDPERSDDREHPAEFYQARGLARLLSDAGRHDEAEAVMEIAKQVKREVA